MDRCEGQVYNHKYVFRSKNEGVYKKILSQPNAEEIKLKSSDFVLDYPYGCYLSCNTPWVLVDHVLIPMNVGEHWILARFDIKQRTLFVYNSFRRGVEDSKVMVHMQRMTVVIPHLLMLSDFYDKRPKVDLNYPFYNFKDLDSPLDISFVDGLPQQSEW